jgi:hypothetical protein
LLIFEIKPVYKIKFPDNRHATNNDHNTELDHNNEAETGKQALYIHRFDPGLFVKITGITDDPLTVLISGRSA